MSENRKYGLLITRPISRTKNIGDYIQSLAARQFIPTDDYYYVDKETVSEFQSEEPVKVIMNAWYMWHPENWPPKDCIQPLLTSMHITPLTASQMLSENGKAYLLKHGPVGCRDTGTQKILDNAGVPCFFSGCLTLTLGETYQYSGKREGVFFVDPFIPPYKYKVNGKTILYPFNLIKSFFYYFRNPTIINKLINSHTYFKGKYFFLTIYNASMFYHIYSTKFSDEMLLTADYVSHIVPVEETDNDRSLMEKAESLVKKYSKANLVVTSRIHCALPCVGLGTPLIFVTNKDMESDKNKYNAPNRFGGLLDFFHTMRLSENKLETDDEELKGFEQLDSKTKIVNKENWRKYRNDLISSCKAFVLS